MKKINEKIVGNIYTGNEELFIQFILGNKKEGKEEIYLENCDTTSQILGNNNTLKFAKHQYAVRDDYNEKLAEGVSSARIGTTLTNLLNKNEYILNTLMKYYKIIEDFGIDKVQELCACIEKILNESNIINVEVKYNLWEILEEANNIKEDTYSDKVQFLNFIEEVLKLKTNDYEYEDLIIIADEILEDEKDIVLRNYGILLKNILYKLEKELKEKLNKPLQMLVSQIFKKFYADYYFATNKNKLFDFLKNTRINMENSPYNTYYKNLYKYMISIENRKIADVVGRFEKFSLQEMSKIFANSLLEDIRYMIENDNNNVVYKFSNEIQETKNVHKCKITSFKELFIVSKHYILQDGNLLKTCKVCGKYFVTYNKTSNEACRRIWTNGKTCSENLDYNNKVGNTIDIKISKEKTAIRNMLKKRDVKHETKEKEIFNDKLKSYINKLDLEKSTKKDKQHKLLGWLKSQHEELKANK